MNFESHTLPDGRLHRIDGPAYVDDKVSLWCYLGAVHRRCGPAIEGHSYLIARVDSSIVLPYLGRRQTQALYGNEVSLEFWSQYSEAEALLALYKMFDKDYFISTFSVEKELVQTTRYMHSYIFEALRFCGESSLATSLEAAEQMV